VQADAVFHLVQSSRQHVYALLLKFPITSKERQELLPLTERDRMLNTEGEKFLLQLSIQFMETEIFEL
jgi:hypothetical protein